MRRLLVAVVVFVAGAIVGRITCGPDARSPPPVDYSQPIELRRADGSHTWLVPVRVCVDGTEQQLRPTDGAPLWVVWYVGSRAQVSYIEQPDPR